MIVEIDESKFGLRKYRRGNIVDDFWVQGIVERKNANKFCKNSFQQN